MSTTARYHPCITACSLALLTLLFCHAASAAAHASSERLSDSVLTDLATHFQLPASSHQLLEQQHTSSWDSLAAVIQRQLHGAGFHRTLEMHVASTPTATAAPTDRTYKEGCEMWLLQPLPSSIFADPYQLEDLTRAAAATSNNSRSPSDPQQQQPQNDEYRYSFKLLGPLDLELPAPACQDTALLLGPLNITAGSQQQQQQQHGAGGGTGGNNMTLMVPLHAKYPQPYAAGYQGWRWTLTGHVAAQLPWPYIVLDCRQQQQQQGDSGGGGITLLPPPPALQEQQQGVCSSSADAAMRQTSSCSRAGGSSSSERAQSSTDSSTSRGRSSEGGRLVWHVPAGNLDHQVLVSWGTLLVTALSCMAVSWSALQSARGQLV